MKLVVDIPKEFVSHFLDDNFVNSLKNIKSDLNSFEFYQSDLNFHSGNYELELLDMLKTAFLNAEVVSKDEYTINSKEYYKKVFKSVDDKYKDHIDNCLKIFFNNDCEIDSIKNYLLTMLKCGLLNSIDLGHIFFIFVVTLYFDENEIDFLLEDLKKQLNKKEWF